MSRGLPPTTCCSLCHYHVSNNLRSKLQYHGGILYVGGFSQFLTASQTLVLPPTDRFRSIMDKAREGKSLLTDEIARGFALEEKFNHDDDGSCNEESTRTPINTAASSITALSDKGALNVE